MPKFRMPAGPSRRASGAAVDCARCMQVLLVLLCWRLCVFPLAAALPLPEPQKRELRGGGEARFAGWLRGGLLQLGGAAPAASDLEGADEEARRMPMAPTALLP